MPHALSSRPPVPPFQRLDGAGGSFVRDSLQKATADLLTTMARALTAAGVSVPDGAREVRDLWLISAGVRPQTDTCPQTGRPGPAGVTPSLLSVAAVADEVGRHPRTVRRVADRLGYAKVGGVYLIPTDDLEAFR